MSCPSCAQPILPEWQHCARCGTSLHGGAIEREHLVTVVVNDLQGSTALAEKLDPESLRMVLDQYFDELGTVLEAYGGRIEKRIGDAMVTVFGLPAAADDDALRAVQAVAEAQAVLANLNARLEHGWGVRLTNRTGVATGPVVFVEAGAGHRVMAGPALEVASALEPVAPPLEALLADTTVEVLGDNVIIDQLASVTLKNGVDTQVAARLIGVESPPDPSERVSDHASDRCLSCGTTIDVAADPPWRWCPMCASPVAVGGPRQASRRTLTIVFADLRISAGSSEEPDARRQATVRCFDELRIALERHGATVEKFIGDAVMAVMGLAQRREDDALRALRAALDMHRVVENINPTLADELGITVELRIGVNTGPVIAGDPRLGQRLVTGDAVNVAARLEQTATPGDTVIGGLTRRLVGDAATVEELEPLTLKGKAEPVPAFRVVEVSTGPATFARFELPLVGRAAELDSLLAAYEGIVTERRLRRIKLEGDTGIGKSRLLYEMFERLPAEARVVRGGCLPYGEGITFWPIIEIIQSACGDTASETPEASRQAVASLVSDPAVAERLWSLAGLTEQQFAVAELFWAVRTMLRELAAERPLVVVIDGLHWAEPTLIELLDDLKGNLDAPILLVTMARPVEDEETAEPEAVDDPDVIRLEPLDDRAADEVIAAALGQGALPVELAERVRRAAAGNPLFIEQFLTMLVDDGLIIAHDGQWVVTADIDKVSVPPTVEAVLAARVDALGDDERGTLEPASVVGREFSGEAVATLVEHMLNTDMALSTLLRRQLVVRARDPDLFVDHRFRTMLLRDVVYDGLLKRTRSVLHQRFADWLEEASTAAGRATEIEEIIGYHLEQAFHLRAGLGAVDDEVIAIGHRAAEHLTPAGERAYVRGDMPAAANLLGRAAATLPATAPARPRLLARAAEARQETGAFRDAMALYDAAEESGRAMGDDDAAGLAELGRVRLRYLTGDNMAASDARDVVDRLMPVFASVGDHRGLAYCHRLVFNIELTNSQWSAAGDAANRQIEHARLAGDVLMERRALPQLAGAALNGPTPVPEGIARCHQVLAQAGGDRMVRAITGRALGHLLAYDGRFEEARRICAEARSGLVELGWHFHAALVSMNSGPIELLAGNPEGAVAELRRDYQTLQAMGEQNYISTTAAFLAEALRRRGDLDEALALAAHSKEMSADDDLTNQVTWRSTAANCLAVRGESDEALRLAAAAVVLSLQTDDITLQADALVGQAEVFEALGDMARARRSLERALASYRAKEHRVGEASTLAALARLTA